MNIVQTKLLLFILILILTSIIFGVTAYAEGEYVHLDIDILAKGGYNGEFSYSMKRTYENKMSSSQSFNETFYLKDFFTEVNFNEISYLSEGLNVEIIDNRYIEISGEIDPGESVSFVLNHYSAKNKSGRSFGKNGATMSTEIRFFNGSETVKMQRIYISFHYPQYASKIYHHDLMFINQNVEIENGITKVNAHFFDKIPFSSWRIIDETIPEEPIGISRKMNIKDMDYGTVTFAYTIKLNTLSHSWTYIAIGIALASLIYSIILTLYLRRNKEN